MAANLRVIWRDPTSKAEQKSNDRVIRRDPNLRFAR